VAIVSTPTADGDAVYDVTAYQLLVNGVDMTLPILGDGNGNGMQIVNNVDAFEAGVFVDALVFFGALPVFGPGGNNIIFAGILAGPTSMFGSTHLPSNLDFLPLTTGLSFWLEEVSDDEATPLARGTFVAAAPTAVPEPATLGLTAMGLTAMLAAGRRRRSAQLD
jgi:hypothetical protein